MDLGVDRCIALAYLNPTILVTKGCVEVTGRHIRVNDEVFISVLASGPSAGR